MLLAIKGAGFISNKLLNSNMTLDVAYTLYLILASTPEIPQRPNKTVCSEMVCAFYTDVSLHGFPRISNASGYAEH